MMEKRCYYLYSMSIQSDVSYLRNNCELAHNAAAACSVVLDTLQKEKEQLRQRKEAEERLAAQNEFLRTSLRGSHKLQALEQNAPPPAQGAFDNDAYEDDAPDSDGSAHHLYKIIGVNYSIGIVPFVRINHGSPAIGPAPLAHHCPARAPLVGLAIKMASEGTLNDRRQRTVTTSDDGLNVLAEPRSGVEYAEVCTTLSRIQSALSAAGEPVLAARAASAAALLGPQLKTALATRAAVLAATRADRSALPAPYTHRATDRLKNVIIFSEYFAQDILLSFLTTE
ncbi:hypothetical protein EVAR_6246_1 [Eumeta japonica]|uniref:Uncharacterized protein n=1 Tax=Eumeta variegata TaxID=151549 RepID=A0A4C1TB57_EUMVA|nr:hypothetical protein EVAR_6246_1 [Eumeta japonica]